MSTQIKPIVIVPCGSAKKSEPCRADEMYIGNYHRACMAYARQLTTPDNILILSAKYGLMRLSYVIEPYERHMRENGVAFWRRVGQQVAVMNLEKPGRRFILLGGREYTQVLAEAWRADGFEVETPLESRGGMGQQIQWMQQQVER